MAELTLNWPVGTYSRVKRPAGSGATLAESTTAYWEFVREGAVTEVGAHNFSVLYKRLVNEQPDKFVNAYGLLLTRGGRETVRNFLSARRELKRLLAAKERDDWNGAEKWMQEHPRVAQFDLVASEHKNGWPQIEFRPRHLFGFIVAQLLTDWQGGAKYKFCKRPSCHEYFYYGAGTGKRETAQYCSRRCSDASTYEKRKGEIE